MDSDLEVGNELKLSVSICFMVSAIPNLRSSTGLYSFHNIIGKKRKIKSQPSKNSVSTAVGRNGE